MFIDVGRIRKSAADRDPKAFLAIQRENAIRTRSQRRDMIKALIDAVLLQALGHPENIDALLNFLAQVARQLTDLVVEEERAEAQELEAPEPEASEMEEFQSKRGGRALVHHLVETLTATVEEISMQNVTPDREATANLPPNYWHIATVNGVLLARFTTQLYGPADSSSGLEDLSSVASEDDKKKFWDQGIAILLGRTIFSRQSNPEPSALVAALALLRGAGSTLRQELKPQGKRAGQGKEWIWYNGAFSQPDASWGWQDVIGAAQQGIDAEHASQYKLPGGLVEGFVSLGSKLGEAEEEKATDLNESAKALLEGKTFKWISSKGADPKEASLRIDRASLLSTMHSEMSHDFEQQKVQARTGAQEGRSADELREQIVALKGFSDSHKIGFKGFAAKDLLEVELGAEQK
ncbi:hypothetical protein CF319_g5282 [Tilletia indica]|uniref:Uncharacterized protein n=1 Tax=Tilletia indica TaxID=43049 RepID=A0A177TUD2_9BASI|nr:hypothetical protein CF319_g5282 [Tilletia indica]KAE8230326.1 hypothetical protein CF326_g4675 [Tilletia indica]KAE8258253.1 hypothetical protein A4X13_0g1812 [Tilletia indica]